MYEHGEAEALFEDFYPSMDAIAGVLVGMAELHYGFVYRIERGKLQEFLDRDDDNLELLTTAEERAEKAKIPFTFFGSTFHSIEEVKKVCKLLNERYADEHPTREQAHQMISSTLAEVCTGRVN